MGYVSRSALGLTDSMYVTFYYTLFPGDNVTLRVDVSRLWAINTYDLLRITQKDENAE